MPARRNQGPPPIEVKQFTLEEIDAGVRKLKRRIDEVKALASQTVRFDDARVESATRNIKADIIDIFGRNSPEYLAHGSHSVGYPEQIYGQEDHVYELAFVKGLPNTVLMLEGLIKRLEENAKISVGKKQPACEPRSMASTFTRASHPYVPTFTMTGTTGTPCSMPRWPS